MKTGKALLAGLALVGIPNLAWAFENAFFKVITLEVVFFSLIPTIFIVCWLCKGIENEERG